jgi:dihydrofolate reductase
MIEHMDPLAIVVAMAQNGIIGCGGKLPWHEPEDLKHFRRLTTGHAVIMGRKTAESIGRPLPQRRNIVVTRQTDWDEIPGFEVAPSVSEAITLARRTDEEPRVIGGGEIYWSALPWTTTIYMTEIQRQVEGDTCFPDFTEFDFLETDRRQSGELIFRTYSRRMFTA